MSSTRPSHGGIRSATSVRVLILDPDGRSAGSTADVLEDEFGIDVTVAATLDEALEVLESVDCVVDAIRPMDAATLDRLRTVRSSAPTLPVVIFSEGGTDELIEAALDADVADYLSREPGDVGSRWLASRVSSALARRTGTVEQRPAPSALDASDGSALLDDSLQIVAVSARYADVHGYRQADLVGRAWATLVLDTEPNRLAGLLTAIRLHGAASVELSSRRDDGSTFDAIVTVYRVGPDRYVSAISVLEASERGESPTLPTPDSTIERRIRRIESLVTGVDEAADPSQHVADSIVDAIAPDPESTPVGVYLYGDSRESLYLTAASSAFEAPPPSIAFDGTLTPVWRAVIDQRPLMVDEFPPGPADPVDEPERTRGIVVPISSHGVLLVGAADGGRMRTFGDTLTRLVGAVAGCVLDRVAAERRLENVEHQLQAARTETERLAETNALVRGVGREIAGAGSRPELEAAICEEIVESERYAFVRIVEADPVGSQLRDRAQAGSGVNPSEESTGPLSSLAAAGEPAAAAIQTHEPHAVRDLLVDSIDDHWQREVISAGYRAAAGVPISYRERVYGAIAIYSELPTAFEEPEQTLLTELGVLVGHAINAIETKLALVAPGGVELEFRVRDRGTEFLEWARETGCTIEFETVHSRSDGTIRGCYTVEGATERRILELASRSAAVIETRLVTQRDDRQLFVSTLTEESILAELLAYGVVPIRMSASEADARLVVGLPAQASVREFVDVVARLYPESTLVRRQDRERVARTRDGFLADLERELTDRQLEALQTAFVAGYFEVPRNASGEEVAAVLDISQPTFNHHLRTAEKKLLATLFTEDHDR